MREQYRQKVQPTRELRVLLDDHYIKTIAVSWTEIFGSWLSESYVATYIIQLDITKPLV